MSDYCKTIGNFIEDEQSSSSIIPVFARSEATKQSLSTQTAGIAPYSGDYPALDADYYETINNSIWHQNAPFALHEYVKHPSRSNTKTSLKNNTGLCLIPGGYWSFRIDA
jgi:hypothetical protein